jgi:hypothetical protein
MMAERRSVGSNVRARSVRDYQARVRELTDAFNLPGDVREWVTVRFDPNADDEAVKFQVTVHAQAGRTVSHVETDGSGELASAMRDLLKEHRADLHAQLKSDLAVNLMAGITEGPVRERE